MRTRLRPRTRVAWASIVLAVTFAVLWAIFAVRAIDRNADQLLPIPSPNLNATYAAARARLPTMPADRPGLTSDPAGLNGGTPIASPVASPIASPAASPST